MTVQTLRYSCALIILSVCVGPLLAQSAEADPQQIAERCVTHMNNDADRAVAYNEGVAERVVPKIEQLLADGKTREAVRLARHAIGQVNHHTHRAGRHIAGHGYRCGALLRRLGEPGLAEQVHAAARDAVARVKASRDAAVEAIKAALPEPPAET